jgi:hypothetical protein
MIIPFPRLPNLLLSAHFNHYLTCISVLLHFVWTFVLALKIGQMYTMNIELSQI